MDLLHKRARIVGKGWRGSGRDERAWVRRAQAGSASDFEALFRAHWAPAYRAAYLVVLGDAAAAEDIAEEAFLAAVRALDRFDRASVRAVAASDRGQPGDRLGSRTGAAARGRAGGHACAGAAGARRGAAGRA